MDMAYLTNKVHRLLKKTVIFVLPGSINEGVQEFIIRYPENDSIIYSIEAVALATGIFTAEISIESSTDLFNWVEVGTIDIVAGNYIGTNSNILLPDIVKDTYFRININDTDIRGISINLKLQVK